jgi:hypothetical protein
MNTQPTPISDRIVSQFRKGEATSDGLILTMVELELKLAAICSERDEARQETIRTREFMDYGFAKAQEELATITAQRDRLAEVMTQILNTSMNRTRRELLLEEALQSLTTKSI